MGNAPRRLFTPKTMANTSLPSASIACLVIWLAIWLLFLVMRFSTFDFWSIPGAGFVMLTPFAVVLVAAVAATELATAALVRQRQVPVNWLTFGCALAALFGQVMLFLISCWI